MTWTYSEHIHSRGTVERLADGFLESLKRLIEHCLSPDSGGYTPSDFPLATFTQQKLDKVMRKVGRVKKGMK
jgi:non-ribosomal peptide synthase protein (TIGR01720 family)